MKDASRIARLLLTAAPLLGLLLMTAVPALAADPTPGPAGGDVRTSATPPGLVGDPIFAVLGVVVIGLLAVAATLIYIRLTERR